MRVEQLVEQLENRRLLAVTASFVNHVLAVTGDAADNHVSIGRNTTNNALVVRSGDTAIKTVNYNDVTSINVSLLGGNDVLNIAPNVAKPSIVSGGDGNDALNGGGGRDLLNGNGGNDALRGGPGADALNGGDGNDLLIRARRRCDEWWRRGRHRQLRRQPAPRRRHARRQPRQRRHPRRRRDVDHARGAGRRRQRQE